MEPDLDRFTSRRSTVYGQRGVVATSQPLASQAGIETLREGGNAFDAAVATAAALNVVEPTSTGLGGDVFALYRTADGEVGAMRACGGAPAAATIGNVREALQSDDDADSYYPDDGGYAVDDTDEAGMPFYGPHAVTVPGTARGWEATIEELGRLTLADVLEPAIRYATEGYPVSEVIASYWAGAEELFTDDHAREAFLFDGDAPETGETVRLPRLGESMRKIAEHGADVVYEGEIAEAIAEEIQSQGGFMTVDDLADFEVEWPEPVSTTYNGAEVYELPPNNQGLIALEALNIAAELGAGEHDYDTAERVHYFAEAMKLAFHDGHRYIADPEYEETPPLGSADWAAKRATGVGPTADHDVIHLTFNDVGRTPGDQYWLYVSKDTGRLDRWAYHLEGMPEEAPPQHYQWTEYRDLTAPAGTVRLAARKEATGANRALLTHNLALPSTPPDGAFSNPEPMLGGEE